MKIKIVRHIPLDPKHGLTLNRIFEAEYIQGGERGVSKFWVVGDAGERCGLMPYEVTVIREDSQP